MTPRNIRRAAERQALNLARKAEHNTPAITSSSAAQIAANQANAKLSCGPVTSAGKLISSLNALKTALTGRTVLLPTDDVAAYEDLLSSYLSDFTPATTQECELVQSLVDTTWRLKRIMNLEFGIFKKGSIEFADAFPDLEPSARAQMIEVETFLKYERSIRNLNMQEARLQRRLSKDALELQRLQGERRELEAAAAASLPGHKQNTAEPPRHSEIGFEFSNCETPSETTFLLGQNLPAPVQSLSVRP